MSRALFGHIWRSNRTRLLIVCVAMAAWSVFLPVVYASFGQQIKQIVDSGIFPKELMNFGGGDPFTLGGSIALGYIHPIAIVLISIFAIGFTTTAVAGERQRGTLRSSSPAVAPDALRDARWLLLFLGLVASSLVGTIIGSAAAGVLDAKLPFGGCPSSG
jgi:hypothetical protein